MNAPRHPYATNILNDKLRQEEKGLIAWKSILEIGDDLAKRQALGNIPSAEHRIAELIKVIDLIK